MSYFDQLFFETTNMEVASPKSLASPFASFTNNNGAAMTQLLNSPVGFAQQPQDNIFDPLFAVQVANADDFHDSAIQQQQHQTTHLLASVHQSSFAETLSNVQEEKSNDGGLGSTTSREWHTNFCESTVISKEGATLGATTKLRSRSDESSHLIPDTLYSSIKYELEHVVALPVKPCPFLLVKVSVVDSVTGEEIKKSGKASILSGKTDDSLLLSDKHGTNTFACKMKIQFTDVSYHHGRKKFAFRVAFYLSNKPDTPFLIKTSAPFLVLARKPKQDATATPKKKAAKKRAREEADSENEEEDQQPLAKKAKVAPLQQQPSVDTFLKQFEVLMNEQFAKLSPEHKRRTSDAIMQRLQKEHCMVTQQDDDLMNTFANLL